MMYRGRPGTGTPLMDFVEPPAQGPILGYSHHEVANLYTYARNNPVNFVDPSGLVPIKCDCQANTGRGMIFFTRTVNCTGVADPCCKKACAGITTSWTGEWEIVPPATHPMNPNSPVKPLTPDFKRVIECCGGDAACERALADLFIQIADTPSQSRYWQTPDKCFNWLNDFLKKNYPKYGPSSGGTISLAGGKIVLRPLEIDTRGGKSLVTTRNRLGMVTGSMTAHGVIEVTFSPNGKPTCVAYFDLGSSTHLGNYGGDDHWFFADEPGLGFLLEMDVEHAKCFCPN